MNSHSAAVSCDRHRAVFTGTVIIDAGVLEQTAQLAVRSIVFIIRDDGVLRLYALQQRLGVLLHSSVMRNFQQIICPSVFLQQAANPCLLNITGKKTGIISMYYGDQQRHIVVVLGLVIVCNAARHHGIPDMIRRKGDFLLYTFHRDIVLVHCFEQLFVFLAVLLVIGNIQLFDRILGKQLFRAADVIFVIVRENQFVYT